MYYLDLVYVESWLWIFYGRFPLIFCYKHIFRRWYDPCGEETQARIPGCKSLAKPPGKESRYYYECMRSVLPNPRGSWWYLVIINHLVNCHRTRASASGRVEQMALDEGYWSSSDGSRAINAAIASRKLNNFKTRSHTNTKKIHFYNSRLSWSHREYFSLLKGSFKILPTFKLIIFHFSIS